MVDPNTQNRIVQIARRWIGTPYHHQASSEGAGADCLGLFRGIWRELFGAEPAEIPPYTADWTATRSNDPLRAAAISLLDQRNDDPMQHGDIMLFRMKSSGPTKHLGVVALGSDQTATLIHAYSQRGVVETHLTSGWLRRSTGVFAIPFRSA